MKGVFFRLLKKPFFGRFMVPWRNPLPEQERKNWQPINVKSKTGAELQLLWYQQQNARGAIVLGHPMGKAAKGVFLKNGHASRLIEKGFNVMLYDFNGFGESQMGSFNFYHDAEAAGLKAKELSPGLSLGYHGISLGGMWICPVLSKETNPFKYVILESAATTLPEFWRHYPLAHKILRLSFFFMPKQAEYLKPIHHISQLKGVEKLLLIYSDTDEYTPLAMGERFQAKANMDAQLWNATGAEHALAYKMHAQAYWVKVIGFFDDHFNND
ncbi:MAG: prolyl oligopeptidase family serine peptidase [Roseivirga sp.]|nr:prolyl oligopeptidase family serine peptidase [Roseivirga sp.]